MSLIAQYEGTCINCDNGIHPGERIAQFQRDNQRVYAHSPRCPESDQERADRTAMLHPICPRCTTRHAGEC